MQGHVLLGQLLDDVLGGEDWGGVPGLEGLHRVGQGGGEGALVRVLQLLPLVPALHLQVVDLHVPVDDEVAVEVLIVLPKRVDEHLGDMEPSEVDNELEQGEDGDVDIRVNLFEADKVDGIWSKYLHLLVCAVGARKEVGGLKILKSIIFCNIYFQN